MDASVAETTTRFQPQQSRQPSVAVIGLGYVGLPTALALTSPVIGIEASPQRLLDIEQGRVDLLPADQLRLADALGSETFRLTLDASALAEADTVLICVPTPVDEDARPDLTALRAACATVVGHARRGQTLVLTSTSYVGTTRELLVAPLQARGLHAGDDIHVAFAPERIDPGNAQHVQQTVPRVVGGATPACAEAAARTLAQTAESLHVVASLEAAELTKLHENTFRAVNIALANELAVLARDLGVDPIEVTHAAATKPYGYMPFFPSAGVGGHCIPCDPHYLLHSLPHGAMQAPLIGQAMQSIAERPAEVARRALECLDGDRVLVVGAAYKPGVADVRESPALQLAAILRDAGVDVWIHDPLVDGYEARPEHDLAVLVTVHPGQDLSWLDGTVLDATYRHHGEVV
ncbi:MAG: UDP-N-acetyl-D-glucosamine dehydrogenase [Solirubrobacteraceae bacterium]|nr:UDP-N-acetyl-D-glucosamine dehydrogenase [Solirubrobacteraceae bacterium]